MQKDPQVTHDPADVAVAASARTTPPPPQELPIIVSPVILKLNRAKNGGRKYSKGTKNSQRFALGLSKSAYRTANSFAEGFWTFSERSDQSAKKRRNGMVRDSLRNASRGFQKGFNQLGKAPGEVARTISGRTVWRAFRVFGF